MLISHSPEDVLVLLGVSSILLGEVLVNVDMVLGLGLLFVASFGWQNIISDHLELSVMVAFQKA